MFAIFIVLWLSAASLEAMDKAPAPGYVSPTLSEPHYRPAMGNRGAFQPAQAYPRQYD